MNSKVNKEMVKEVEEEEEEVEVVEVELILREEEEDKTQSRLLRRLRMTSHLYE